MSNDIRFTSDHLAVTALPSPNSAARTDVNIMNALRFELLCAANVVDVIGVSAVDDGIAWLYNFNQLMENSIDKSGRYHQPDRTRWFKLFNKLMQRSAANCALVYKCFHRLRATIVNDAFEA